MKTKQPKGSILEQPPYKYGQAYYDSLAANRVDRENAASIRIAGQHLRQRPDDAQPIFNTLGTDYRVDLLGPQAEKALIRMFAGKHGSAMMSAAFGGFDDKNCYALADTLLNKSEVLPSGPQERVAWFGQQLIEKLAGTRHAN